MLKATKVTALVIIPVLSTAFVFLWVFPGRTHQLWAWTMRPDMTPITMGAGYLGGAWFFFRVATNRHPSRVAGGLAAASVFTGLLGIATILHWEVFNHDHVSFWAWLFLYAVSPFLLPVLAAANRRAAAAEEPTSSDRVEIPGWARTILVAVGGVTVVGALVTFAFPASFAERWPWSVTPVAARSLSAYAAFTGLLLLTPLVDRRWVAVRMGVEAVTIGLAMTGLGALRASDDFTGPAYAVNGFAAALVTLLGVLVLLQLRLSKRGGAATGKPAPAPRGQHP